MKCYVNYDPETGAINSVYRIANPDQAKYLGDHLLEVSPEQAVGVIQKTKMVDLTTMQLVDKPQEPER